MSVVAHAGEIRRSSSAVHPPAHPTVRCHPAFGNDADSAGRQRNFILRGIAEIRSRNLLALIWGLPEFKIVGSYASVSGRKPRYLLTSPQLQLSLSPNGETHRHFIFHEKRCPPTVRCQSGSTYDRDPTILVSWPFEEAESWASCLIAAEASSI